MKEKLLSMREYAKLRGVSAMAVSKAVKTGRISLTNGKIEPKSADEAWSKNTHARPERKSTVATARPRLDDSDCETMAEAQFRHEKARARKAELEARKLEGQLVEVDEVIKTWERHIDAIKNRLLLLESKVPADCRSQVSREIRSALNELSEYKDAA